MARKRILQIIPTLDRAGAEKQLTLLAAALPRDEFDVHVFALTRGGPLEAELRQARLPTTVIGKPWKIDPRAFWRLQRQIQRLQPDLIHTWLFAANSYGRAAGLAAGVKLLVASERCVDPWKGRRDLTIDRILARRTDRILANSSAVRDFYVSHGLPADKFVLIPNGVPTPGRPCVTRRTLLAELDLPDDSRLIGLVARLWPQKRVKDAIWAADLLKTVRPDTHLLILGDGPQRDRLRRYRDLVEIRDRVHFLGHRNDAARFIPHFDLLWSTSDYEGQSNAIMEAMAHGVPVVATDIPGAGDLVVDGQTGFLVSTQAADARRRRGAFAKHANRILDDPDLAHRLGQAARRRMREQFSVEQMVDRHAQLYRELLE